MVAAGEPITIPLRMMPLPAVTGFHNSESKSEARVQCAESVGVLCCSQCHHWEWYASTPEYWDVSLKYTRCVSLVLTTEVDDED
jgi:hypothetical protein